MRKVVALNLRHLFPTTTFCCLQGAVNTSEEKLRTVVVKVIYHNGGMHLCGLSGVSIIGQSDLKLCRKLVSANNDRFYSNKASQMRPLEKSCCDP